MNYTHALLAFVVVGWLLVSSDRSIFFLSPALAPILSSSLPLLLSSSSWLPCFNPHAACAVAVGGPRGVYLVGNQIDRGRDPVTLSLSSDGRAFARHCESLSLSLTVVHSPSPVGWGGIGELAI